MSTLLHTAKRFGGWVAAIVVSLFLLFMASFITSMFVVQTDECEVTSKASLQIGRNDTRYRVYTDKCGTFGVSAVPLRGYTTEDAIEVFHSIREGDTYTMVYVQEGWGRLGAHPSLIAAIPMTEDE